MRVTEEIRAALARVDEAFDRKLPRLAELCSQCVLTTRDEPKLAPFEAVVRTYRARRLELPIRMIWGQAFGHGSGLVHGDLRRLAWFVPSLFATALEDGQLARVLGAVADLGDEARQAERRYRPEAPRDLSPDERAAATGFLAAALGAVVAGERFVVREAAAIFAAAEGLAIPAAALVARWLEAPDAELSLARALVGDDEGASLEDQLAKLRVRTSEVETTGSVDAERALARAVSTEEVRRRIEARCLEEDDPNRADLLSRAEEAVRDARRFS
jgi:hypothetical protein